jgi:hypothetical protein
MSTVAERTVLVPDQVRLVFIDLFDENRIVNVRAENRTVNVERKPNSADRTVYANED